jgi:hypothetical protein
MDDLAGTRWLERDAWSGRRVIEVISRDGDGVTAVTVENSQRPEAVGRPLPRPIAVATLRRRWSPVDEERTR